MIYPKLEYNPDATCPKCHFGHITTTYKPKLYFPVPLFSECLERTCPNCAYKWLEKVQKEKERCLEKDSRPEE